MLCHAMALRLVLRPRNESYVGRASFGRFRAALARPASWVGNHYPITALRSDGTEQILLCNLEVHIAHERALGGYHLNLAGGYAGWNDSRNFRVRHHCELRR